MKSALIITLFAVVLGGCVGQNRPPEYNKAELIELEPGKTWLDLRSREWRGFWGPEGYIGYKPTSYWAALEGYGPVFRDPWFTDFTPGTLRMTGTVTVDRQRMQVIVDMRRVVSQSGGSEKTKASPANGTYSIIEGKRTSEDKKLILERFVKMTSH